MGESTYNMITTVLGIASLVALVVMAVSFIAMIVRWNTTARRRHAIRFVAALAAIPCLIAVQQSILWFVFLPSLGRQQMAVVNAARAETTADSSLVAVGDPAPAFSLTTADGDEVSVPESGKVVLINFFATWCGPCKVELPHVERIWTEKQGNEHFRLLVIGREETDEMVRDFRAEHGFTFPIAADPQREVYSLFATELIPRTLVVSPEGKVVYSKAGFYEDDVEELVAVLEEQLAGFE